MADALLSIVLEELVSIVQQEVKLALNVRKDVNDLSDKLKMVKAVLHDAEMKQFKEEAVKLLMEQLKDILYDADDVLDEWYTRINLNSSQIQGVDNDDGSVRFRKKVISYFLCSCFSLKSVVGDYGFGTRIKEIREHFDEITKNKEFLMLNQGQSHEEPHQRLITSSVVDVSEIYGRDHDKKIIISKLLSESSHQDLNTHVISIVGTGGFGKTTLAKLVLQDEEVKKTFEKIMWVCVSEPFNLIEVSKAIIQEAEVNVPTVSGWQALHQCLCNSVKGSRFLLVLDDVWTKNNNDWNPLKLSLNGGAGGSRIIVSTRIEKVAQMMDSSYIHNLKKLSEDDSWSLFERIAFFGRQEDLAKLENIGKEISKKCNGVPLAITIVASHMRYKKAKKDWNNVLRSEIWDIQQIQEDFLPSLLLSYYPLPSALKQCFMYCAIFPKDRELEKDQLVKLWMAQGFLGSGGEKELEKIGEDYFDDLAMRSFFQISRRDHEGNIISCMMHDLVHDFAQFLAKEECCSLELGKLLDNISKVRHIGNYFPMGEDCSTIYTAKNLRTLLASSISINLTMVFKELKFLRVLDLSFNSFEQLPDEVERLLHLRYLDLSYNRELLELPKTISRLYNLQTLNLNVCTKLIKLPDGIVELLNLRHLETDELSCLPRGIGRLKFLRTLCKFIVGDASNGCEISELKDLCFLQGSLEIKGLGRVTDANKAAQAELKKKMIDVLSLDFDNSEEGNIENMSVVFENLQPHEDVQELNIFGFAGFKFPSWFSNSSMLMNLVRLRLKNCKNTKELPALGNLVALEKLEIKALSSVKHIGTQFCGFGQSAFPKLKKLVISRMLELIRWELPISTDATTIMPCLQKLELKDCPMLKALPGLGRLESLESLEIVELPSIKRVGLEFWGISADEFGGEELILFPRLTKLWIFDMKEWEEWIMPPFQEDRQIIVMPCLRQLYLDCPKLEGILPDLLVRFKSLEILRLNGLEKCEDISLPCLRELQIRDCGFHVIPRFLFPHTLRELAIKDCKNLRGMQPCLPPLLEILHLWYDVGVLSESLPIGDSHNYLNLRSFTIYNSNHPSLPKGFNHLTAIQCLQFYKCESLDFDLNELKHLTMLQTLSISGCPILAKRFQSSGDDYWMSILSHVPYIYIDDKNIRESD